MKALPSLGIVVYAIAASTIGVEAVYACPTTASYSSVVVNDAPPEIPLGSKTFKVRIESGLFSPATNNIYGLSGSLVEETTDYKVGTKIEARANLASMCDTWVDVWTSNPDVDGNGRITGYVTGHVEQVAEDGTLEIRPLLFRRAADRTDYGNGNYREGSSRRTPRDLVWKPFTVDADQISSNLSETNRLILEHLDKMEKDRLEKEKAEIDEQ